MSIYDNWEGCDISLLEWLVEEIRFEMRFNSPADTMSRREMIDFIMKFVPMTSIELIGEVAER